MRPPVLKAGACLIINFIVKNNLILVVGPITYTITYTISLTCFFNQLIERKSLSFFALNHIGGY